jgi:molecular chaperone DnaK
MGTGKEQSIKITASSGLKEDEIKNLVKDAELHAEEDHKKRELVDARNTADSLIYSTEKSMKELGDKLDGSTKSDIDRAVANLKNAMETDNTAEIKKLSDELTQVSHKVAEAMYAQAAGKAQAGAQGDPGAGSSAKNEPKDDNVVDADFEEVKK